MIKSLQRKLLLLFTSSVMLVVTLVFGILIQNNISSARKAENSFFERTATHILFSLSNGADVASDFSLFESTYPIAFRYLDESGNTLYETASHSFADISGIMSAFEVELKKEQTLSLADSPYSQSGIFYFSYKNIPYCGICCDITHSTSQTNSLYLVKQDKTVPDSVKENIIFYLLIWIVVSLIILAICKYLIRKATKPTELAIQSQKNFIAAASHELKAPLAVILTNAEVVSTDPAFNKHLQKNMSAIDSECMRMSSLVQDLLLLSSIDANTWSLNKSVIDIYTLILTMYEKFEPVCKKNGMELLLAINNDNFPKLSADEDRLEQTLSIFLDNAIQYGNPDTSIELTVYTEAKYIVFSIRDHGIGIKDADKPFIYNRFYQADNSHTRTQHYGLGLSIAKELVEMHKGKLELSDTPGGGCTFNIYFPSSK